MLGKGRKQEAYDLYKRVLLPGPKQTGQVPHSITYSGGRVITMYTRLADLASELNKLEELENILDPENFMRVNRSFILHIDTIKDVIVYSNSRLKVIPDQDVDREIIISREKVPQFKAWIDGRS